MGTLIFSNDSKLTDDPAHAKIRETYKGQAHIAGTGPENTTCRECKFWGTNSPEIYIYNGHRADCQKPGILLEGQCHRHKPGQAFQLFPHDAKSCVWFEKSKNPPAAYRPADNPVENKK